MPHGSSKPASTSFWTPVDMSFGVIGLVPLLLAYQHIRKLEQA